jgi:VIT1/CCC1 family predicted Fe2+/Mn2+ transporter
MNELMLAHIIIAFSALLPAALLKLLNLKGTAKGVGFNTASAHLSDETRAFSTRYATTGMFWAGIATVFVQVTLYFLTPGEPAILITAGVMTVAFLAVTIMTQLELKKRFDDKGKPRKDYSGF